MVHALELACEMLAPGGCLIDIHPTGEPPPLELCIDERRFELGNMQEIDDFVEYLQASAALQEAERRNWLRLEREEVFRSRTIAPTLDELQSYLTESWSDAILPGGMEEKLALIPDFASQNHSRMTFEIIERVRISRWKKSV